MLKNCSVNRVFIISKKDCAKKQSSSKKLEDRICHIKVRLSWSSSLKVKGYICEKRGIRYVWVPLRRKDSLSEYAQRMKLALQKVHVYFPSDEEQDVELLRRLFDDWRRRTEIT